jgi:hypothetical protein
MEGRVVDSAGSESDDPGHCDENENQAIGGAYEHSRTGGDWQGSSRCWPSRDAICGAATEDSMNAAGVAVELRKLADCLDKDSDSELGRVNVWAIYHAFSGKADKDKEHFLSFARMMPRPITKSKSGSELVLEYRNGDFSIDCRIPQSVMCELVEPAKPAVYKCHPILSDEEDAALEAEAL